MSQSFGRRPSQGSPLATKFSSLLQRGWAPHRLPKRIAPRRFQVERLEDRCLMDGAGFVHTNPTPDPDSVVGVAGIAAHDDYVDIGLGTQELRIDVLGNDSLAAGSSPLRIKSVGKTHLGATASISEDAQRIIYRPPAAGTGGNDAFTYTVEDAAGHRGKANVSVRHKEGTLVGYGFAPYGGDYFLLFEDAPPQTLDVLPNDGEFASGEIIAVSNYKALWGDFPGYSYYGSLGGRIAITPDGKSLHYTPPVGKSGFETFYYTVRDGSGREAVFGVSVSVAKPVRPLQIGPSVIDAGTGSITRNLITDEAIQGPTPETPRIVEVTQPQFGGRLRIGDDGKSVVFDPENGFLGTVNFQYTIRYGPQAHQTVTGSDGFAIRNTFLAVEDWFLVEPGSGAASVLDVLHNDANLTIDGNRYYNWGVDKPVSLSIVDVSAGSRGGSARVIDGERIYYLPAASFVGDDTFTYTVADSNGVRKSATATIHVGVRPETVGLPKILFPGELRQMLVDRVVETYKYEFGRTYINYSWRDYVSFNGIEDRRVDVLNGDMFSIVGTATDVTFTRNNAQVAGVDEADVVETDGDYVYSFSHGKLAIVDVRDLHQSRLVSAFDPGQTVQQMYLQGDRLTLLHRGESGIRDKASLTVLDVSDRAHPRVLERTFIDGQILDSRAVGNRVYVVASGSVLETAPMQTTVIRGDGSGMAGMAGDLVANESFDHFLSRLGDRLVQQLLPNYHTYDGEGRLVAEGLLTAETRIHKALNGRDENLLSLTVFDVGDYVPGPQDSEAVFASNVAQTYMTDSSFYVFSSPRNPWERGTTILKFSVANDTGGVELAATGHVDGTLHNSYSVDERDGRLRIATTAQTVWMNPGEGWNPVLLQSSNSLLILEQQGGQLKEVGGVRYLAPNETIRSVRFFADRVYVATFRMETFNLARDPLYAIDLSDPIHPVVTGELHFPGFTEYLHPVSEDYLLGVGHAFGGAGDLQVMLFYVGGGSPAIVDQLTMDGATWAVSDAWSDPHAFSYFADQGLLSIPVQWNVPYEGDESQWGYGFNRLWTESHAGVWTIDVTIDGLGGGDLASLGAIEHAPEDNQGGLAWNSWGWFNGARINSIRRSLQIGDALVTVSEDYLQVNSLADPAEQWSRVFLVANQLRDDSFHFDQVDETGSLALDVLANDRLDEGGESVGIASVTAPKAWTSWNYNSNTIIDDAFHVTYFNLRGNHENRNPGTTAVSADGQHVIFTPFEGFYGTAQFTYSVNDPVRGMQQATVTVTVGGGDSGGEVIYRTRIPVELAPQLSGEDWNPAAFVSSPDGHSTSLESAKSSVSRYDRTAAAQTAVAALRTIRQREATTSESPRSSSASSLSTVAWDEYAEQTDSMRHRISADLVDLLASTLALHGAE